MLQQVHVSSVLRTPDLDTVLQVRPHQHRAEVKYRLKPYYMRKQPDITAEMRAILVDWLVEVGEEYKLRTETLYLAVNYLDRFLSCMSVLRGKLQLVGTAAILLAAKYEEIYPPEVDEFVYITDDTYTKRQLLRMEHLLLKVLAFDLTVCTLSFPPLACTNCGGCLNPGADVALGFVETHEVCLGPLLSLSGLKMPKCFVAGADIPLSLGPWTVTALELLKCHNLCRRKMHVCLRPWL
uniref:Cyclin-like domain-containing protein n=1 Tax=Meleagris gallopavo TaxID=9103 RepID=A0A803YJV4_MELGA